MNQVTRKVKQKFVNRRNIILIILFSNFDPKFYNVLSKTCLESAVYELQENNRKSSHAYSETCQTLKMKFFTKIVNGFQTLTIFAKSSIVNIWQGSEYVSGYSQEELISFRSQSIDFPCKAIESFPNEMSFY